MTIKHKQTGKTIELSWQKFMTSPDYADTKHLWEVVIKCDPVIYMVRDKKNGKFKEHGLIDRDVVKKIIDKNPKDYHLKELPEGYLEMLLPDSLPALTPKTQSKNLSQRFSSIGKMIFHKTPFNSVKKIILYIVEASITAIIGVYAWKYWDEIILWVSDLIKVL